MMQFEDVFEAAASLESLLKASFAYRPTELNFAAPKEQHAFVEDRVHITEITGDCWAKAAYRLRDVAQGVEAQPEQYHWSHEGFLKEEWVRAVLDKAMPGEFQSNQPVPLTPDLEANGVQGYYDLFSERLGLVIDVKSRDISTVGKDGGPSAKDCRQVALYGALLSRAHGKPVHALLAYIPRQDLSQLRVYPVAYDIDLTLERASQTSSTIRAASQEDSAIPVEHSRDAYPCSWKGASTTITCPYHSRCYLPREEEATTPAPADLALLVQKLNTLREERLELERRAEAIKEESSELNSLVLHHLQGLGGKADVPEVGVVQVRTVAPKMEVDPDLVIRNHPDLKPILDKFRTLVDTDLMLKVYPELQPQVADCLRSVRAGSSYLVFPRKK